RTLVRARHAAFFLALAEEADPRLRGSQQAKWLDCLETEHDNFRAVLEWSKTAEDGAIVGLRLSVALGRFWRIRGHLHEGRERYDAVLSRQPEGEQTKWQAKLLIAAGNLAMDQGDYTAARCLYEKSLAIVQELGDRHGIAGSFHNLGIVAYE